MVINGDTRSLDSGLFGGPHVQDFSIHEVYNRVPLFWETAISVEL